MIPSYQDLRVETLGPCEFDLPPRIGKAHDFIYVEESERVLLDDTTTDLQLRACGTTPVASFEQAGPRKKVFFDPKRTTCAIVTCGGLCPGLNDVIRGVVLQAFYRYGMQKFYGIRYGYAGFIKRFGYDPIMLTPEVVSQIHRFGGSFLGSSRGPQDVGEVVDRLEELKVDILFVVGGDGTLRGGLDIFEEAKRRGKALSLIGVPKTIDNDIMWLDKSFGYETAFAEAVEALTAAHAEARGSNNGVGLVKLMGRHSGFIASSAALATGEVNFVFIPEAPMTMHGERGFLKALHDRLKTREHAVVVVAEGACQEMMEDGPGERDASGNLKLKDVGVWMKGEIENYFKQRDIELNLKYIDPSYMIRSVAASPQDRVYCIRLAQAAVHAGMAGKTGMVVGRWHSHYVHIPIKVAVSGRRNVDPRGDLWQSVLESTGQTV